MENKMKKILFESRLKKALEALKKKFNVSIGNNDSLTVKTNSNDKLMYSKIKDILDNAKIGKYYLSASGTAGNYNVVFEFIIRRQIRSLIKEELKLTLNESEKDGVVKIFIDGYPWYLQKIDSTHFHMSNSPNKIWNSMSYHIGQHRSEPYYNDVDKWLHGGFKIDDKKYFSDGKNENINEGFKKPKVGDYVTFTKEANPELRGHKAKVLKDKGKGVYRVGIIDKNVRGLSNRGEQGAKVFDVYVSLISPELDENINEVNKKTPQKNDKVTNISSGWKGIVIDTNRKQDSSLVKYTHNPKREPDWIANNDLRIESKMTNEKAVSKAQQRFFGMVDAAQKGEKPASKEIGDVTKKMKKKDVKDFARTKHTGLPERVPKNK